MHHRCLRCAIGCSLLGSLALASGAARAADCDQTSVGLTPINELGRGLYLGQFEGGLYFGSNEIPHGHREVGMMRAHAVQPLDADGNPHPDGKYVLLSIGMSNAAQEFNAFRAEAMTHPLVNHDALVILNGAAGGQTTSTWDSPDDANYDRIRDQVLAPQGLTEAQVQAAWVKLANASPTVSLPDANADAFTMLEQLGDTVRAMRERYPNLNVVFLTSRIYAGYASTQLNPEPFAYESGFAVKWLIQAQIKQHAVCTPGQIDPIAGDLSYDEVLGAAPWLVWAPYMWADGVTERFDGLTWACSDFQDDGTHPSASGAAKVTNLLLPFMLNSPFAKPWFRAAQPAPGDLNIDGVVDELDRAILCSRLGTSQGQQGFIQRADLNNDGTIDHLDQAIFNEILPPCIGDVAASATLQPPADGVVNAADLAFLLGAWRSGPSCADFVTSATFAQEPDGTVDGADLAALLGGWGGCE
jgi:hypothetical protein